MAAPDPNGMKSVDEARELILAALAPVGPETLTIDRARGRVLAIDVVAPSAAPRFAQSAMDGYALRWDDLAPLIAGERDAVELPVAFTVAAGDPGADPLPVGAAARIMTGAPVPVGADSVVMREDTEERGATVVVRRASGKGRGANVRPAGSYFEAGAALVGAGAALDPGAIGLIASVGQAVVTVHRRPRVAIVSTGDELVPLGVEPGPGQIVNSSAHMLAALVEEAGASALVMPIARDTVADCRARFDEAVASADLVLSIGGVSVGDFDVVRDVIGSLGDGVQFWKVRMKPGKPLAFGVVAGGAGRGIPLVGLPGNPVSSYVCFSEFVRPAIRKLAGRAAPWGPRRERVALAAPVRSTPWREDFQRGTLRYVDGAPRFVPFADQASGNLCSLLQPDALGVIPEGVASLEVGDDIEIERLPGAFA
jgi:molybdopterin molybdotransferase